MAPTRTRGVVGAVFRTRTQTASLAGAVLLDRLFGEPPNAAHPVVWTGHLISRVFRVVPDAAPPRAKLIAGAAGTATVILAAAVPAWLLSRATHQLPEAARAIVVAAALKPAFAWKALEDHTNRVIEALEGGDLAGARVALSMIVSRQTASLDEARVAAGAIESLAENLSDSVIAPLFWYAIAGLPGAWTYRAANTLDAMVGYRNSRYEHLGKAAARLDDLLNWAPSRITAALIILAAWLTGASAAGGARILRRDGGRTASPNAGRPMSAMAGALGVELEKVDHYRLGEGLPLPATKDLRRAQEIARVAAALAVLLAATRRADCGWTERGRSACEVT